MLNYPSRNSLTSFIACLMVYRYLNRIHTIPFLFPKQVTTQVCFQRYYFVIVNKMEKTKSLKELGYVFNSAGQLRKVGASGEVTEELFQFNISDNHQECQAHYEEIGTAITPHIYNLLETREKLIRLPVPNNAPLGSGTFIFVSENYDEKHILLVLIHGTGVVRAGQWARSLIINESLDYGTQIPYIRKAINKGYGVMVLNTNDNFTTNGKKIPKSGTAEEHAQYVWETYITKTNADSILIVAHSYGGVVTLSLANEKTNDFENRVKAVAFTDSVHAFSNHKVSKYLKQIATNWIASPELLDTPLKCPEFDISRVSAGHTKHEMTSYSSMESVFKYFDSKLQKES